MFLRRHTKHIGGKDHTYGSLVKTVRTAKGPRHEWVAPLGTLSPTKAQQVHQWSALDSLLEGKTPAQQLTSGSPTFTAGAAGANGKYGQAQQVWVMDRSQSRQLEKVLLDKTNWHTVRRDAQQRGCGVEVSKHKERLELAR